MRIATWNLDRCRPGTTATASRLSEWMARIDADIWVLTETHRGFPPGPGYQLVAHSADAPDRDAAVGECWVAVWSRLPAEPVRLSADMERTAAAKVGEGVVVGSVLPWLSDSRDPLLRGAEAFLARLAEQAADWRRLRALGSALCVAGDFNQDLLPAGHYYGSAEGRQALWATLAEVGLECLTGGQEDPLAAVPGLACIDHICVAGLQARGWPPCPVWPPPGSLLKGLTDHYGVCAEVEVAARPHGRIG